MEKRVKYLDIAKGIGMICIIFGHLGIDRVNSFVFTFHVPIFFLISGYFLKDNTSIQEFVSKKVKQLILPYSVTCIGIIFGVTIWDILKNHTFANVVYNLKTYTIASIYGSGTIEYTEPFYIKQIGALWFLLALFFAMIIARVLMQYRFGVLGVLIIAYIGYKTSSIFWLPFSIQSGMTASLFVYLGMLAKKYKIMERRCPPILLTAATAVWLWCILFYGRFYIVTNYCENGIMDILGALAGSYIIILLSKVIERRTEWTAGILEFFGENSLMVLCCHAFDLNVISWDWVWKVFSDRLGFQYCNVVIILVILKLMLYAVGICVIKFLIRKIKESANKILSWFRELSIQRNDKGAASDGRIKYWDMAKGIAIMTMILGHTDLPDYLRVIIFSFHMPFFIIANGFFVKDYNIKKIFIRSVKSLLVPYVVTCLLSAVIYACYGNSSAECLQMILIKIKAMIGGMSKISTRFQSFESVWVVWFVVSLFLTRNMYVIIMKAFEKYCIQVRIAIIFMLSVAGGMIGTRYAFLPWSMDVALVSLVFIAMGDWMKKTDFLNKSYWYTLVLPAAVWIYFLRMGINIELATRSYPFGVFCVIEAIAGSITVITISKFLSKFSLLERVLSWIGKNSMLILGIHCLEMMYFDWNSWVYRYLPFTTNWFRVFVIKSMVILIVAGIVSSVLRLIKRRRMKEV